MNVCENHAFVVIYERGRCPACDMEKSIEEWEKENSELKDNISDLWKENEDLKNAAQKDAAVAV
jgi:hypothetical protein